MCSDGSFDQISIFMTEISNVWLHAFFKSCNNNCTARMKELVGEQAFCVPALLQMATRGHCFTPNPHQLSLKQMNAGIIHCSVVKTYRTMTHILLFTKKNYTVAIKKSICFINLFWHIILVLASVGYFIHLQRNLVGVWMYTTWHCSSWFDPCTMLTWGNYQNSNELTANAVLMGHVYLIFLIMTL